MKPVLKLTLALSWLLPCCSNSYRETSFKLESTPPVAVDLESDLLRLASGVAVKVKATPRARRGYASDVRLTLTPQDQDIVTVYEGQGRHEFVLVGLMEGDSCLDVTVSGVERECVPVHVGPHQP